MSLELMIFVIVVPPTVTAMIRAFAHPIAKVLVWTRPASRSMRAISGRLRRMERMAARQRRQWAKVRELALASPDSGQLRADVQRMDRNETLIQEEMDRTRRDHENQMVAFAKRVQRATDWLHGAMAVFPDDVVTTTLELWSVSPGWFPAIDAT